MNKVLVICGPTCVGKTSLSIKLASLLNGEIINGDSMQVYKGMDIGTAKIAKDEMMNIPHHLLDILDLDQDFSVADFQKLVRGKINEITNRNHLPIIVGGTGLYLKAALYDYEFKPKEKSINKYNDLSNEELFSLLEKLDQETSKTIHPNNRKRVLRAIEIFEENGIGKEDINKSQTHKSTFNALFLGLRRERKDLYKLIDERVDEMINKGLIDEAKKVLEKSIDGSTCSQAIGYKELKPYFNNSDTLENCVAKIKSNTHRFVKRQFTWFNHQVDVKWVDVDNKDINQIVDDSLKIIREWKYEK